MINIIFIIIISFIISLIALIIQHTHFLISLFCLEAIILSMIILISIINIYISIYTPFISIILLTLGACEARLGLSLLVIISRSSGSDILNSLTINKC